MRQCSKLFTWRPYFLLRSHLRTPPPPPWVQGRTPPGSFGPVRAGRGTHGVLANPRCGKGVKDHTATHTAQRHLCVLLSECDALVHSPSPPHTHRQIYGRASPPTFFKPRAQQHQRTKIRWQKRPKRPINPHISKKFATSRCGFRHRTCIFAAHSPNAVQTKVHTAAHARGRKTEAGAAIALPAAPMTAGA